MREVQPMSAKSQIESGIDRLFAEAEPHLVGVWKFQERGKAPLWCATVLVKGTYFDVAGSPTIKETLEQVLREVADVD